MSVVPDGVRRVQWIFGRQDVGHHKYPTPISVTLKAHNNLVIAAIPDRPTCTSPNIIRWYGADRHLIASRGGPAAGRD